MDNFLMNKSLWGHIANLCVEFFFLKNIRTFHCDLSTHFF